MYMIKTEYAEAIKTMAIMCRDLAENKSCLSCPFHNRKRGRCYFTEHIPLEYAKTIKEKHTIVYEINEDKI